MKQETAINYDKYREIQVEANVRKFQNIWATPAEMDAVAQLIRTHVPQASFGLCHGARNGQEVRLLKERLGDGVKVLGTDISPSASAIEDMTQWDFHDLHYKWTGRTDFIYSNSWDHTYDIGLLAHSWAMTLKRGGLAIIHWTKFHTEAGMNDGPDMFGTGEDEIAAVFAREGLRELDRVRLSRSAETNGVKIHVPAQPTAPHADAGVVEAHYVEHDGEVVLIPLIRDAS
jgi:hypothetical protein